MIEVRSNKHGDHANLTIAETVELIFATQLPQVRFAWADRFAALAPGEQMQLRDALDNLTIVTAL